MGKSTAVTCELCGLQINRKVDLKRHMMLHSDNKEDLKHPCPYLGCSFRTLQKSNLDSHINTHTGLRPYECPTRGCGFRTSDRGSLTRHRKELHGYVPRRRAKAHPADGSDATEFSTPWPTPCDLTSSVETFSDLYQTHLPELSQIPELYDLLVPPANCCMDDSSSSYALTDPFVGYPWVNNGQYPLVRAETTSLFPSLASGLVMSGEMPMLDHTQVSAAEQGSFPVVSLPAQPISEPTAFDVSDAIFDDLLAQTDGFQASVYITPFAPHPPPSMTDLFHLPLLLGQ